MNHFGIDVHSTYHKVVLTTQLGEVIEHDIPNDDAGRASLAVLTQQYQPCSVAMEACTGAYRLYDLLEPNSARIVLLHPAEFRTRFPKRGRKNDRIDAHDLCEASRFGMKGIWVPDETIRQWRILSKRRMSLTESRTRSKNAVKSLFREYHIPLPKNAWSLKSLASLRERAQRLPENVRLALEMELELLEKLDDIVDKLDLKMADLASRDEDILLLMSVPGINYHSAFVLKAEMGSHSRFESAKQIAGYAGLCPSFTQTGLSKTRNGSITKTGRPGLRWIAVECAQSAVRYTPKLRRLYWRVLKRSKSTGKAKVAAARKLLTLCYHILKSGKPFLESDNDLYARKLAQLMKRAAAANPQYV